MEEKKCLSEDMLFLFFDIKGDLTPADAMVINAESTTNIQHDCECVEGCQIKQLIQMKKQKIVEEDE
ncbi:hypothetical protein CRD70_14025 [Listeria monocytogenes]|uniref:Uncharacterized protein n=1 Tax=Listeria monocytogenes TaxID=1639 RepID=A0A823J5W1_LISMN|nr:hypothetical protein [Listeria monocytogenes]EAG9355037.1 hypothetical protein [Listeria monocytogenes]RFQ28471.1 hypothetical protein CRD70_14025 [Listeria monocytogenes]UIJ56407.1 hypothetical protein LZJ94_14655 [Listeria monocytogenes]WIH38241.1 hypothetical protein MZN47_14480 [Listeria monocytogenes]